MEEERLLKFFCSYRLADDGKSLESVDYYSAEDKNMVADDIINSLGKHCFPLGTPQVSFKRRSPSVHSFRIVVSSSSSEAGGGCVEDSSTSYLYGGCLSFDEEIFLSEDATASTTKVPLPPSSSSSSTNTATTIRLFSPKALIFVSEHEYCNTLMELVKILYRVSQSRPPLPIEHYVHNMLTSIKLPPSDGTKIYNYVLGHNAHCQIERPPGGYAAAPSCGVPPWIVDIDIARVLQNISADALIQIVSIAACERDVVIVGNNANVVSAVCHLIRALMAPLKWCGLFYPITPRRMAISILKGMVSSQPHIVGLLTSQIVTTTSSNAQKEDHHKDDDDDIISIDLLTGCAVLFIDKHVLALPGGDTSALLPSQLYKQLLHRLLNCCKWWPGVGLINYASKKEEEGEEGEMKNKKQLLRWEMTTRIVELRELFDSFFNNGGQKSNASSSSSSSSSSTLQVDVAGSSIDLSLQSELKQKVYGLRFPSSSSSSSSSSSHLLPSSLSVPKAAELERKKLILERNTQRRRWRRESLYQIQRRMLRFWSGIVSPLKAQHDKHYYGGRRLSSSSSSPFILPPPSSSSKITKKNKTISPPPRTSSYSPTHYDSKQGLGAGATITTTTTTRTSFDSRRFVANFPREQRAYAREILRTSMMQNFLEGGHEEFFDMYEERLRSRQDDDDDDDDIGRRKRGGGGGKKTKNPTKGDKDATNTNTTPTTTTAVDNDDDDNNNGWFPMVEEPKIETNTILPSNLNNEDDDDIIEHLQSVDLDRMTFTEQQQHLQRLHEHMLLQEYREVMWFRAQKGWKYAKNAFPKLKPDLFPKDLSALKREKLSSNTPRTTSTTTSLLHQNHYGSILHGEITALPSSSEQDVGGGGGGGVETSQIVVVKVVDDEVEKRNKSPSSAPLAFIDDDAANGHTIHSIGEEEKKKKKNKTDHHHLLNTANENDFKLKATTDDGVYNCSTTTRQRAISQSTNNSIRSNNNAANTLSTQWQHHHFLAADPHDDDDDDYNDDDDVDDRINSSPVSKAAVVAENSSPKSNMTMMTSGREEDVEEEEDDEDSMMCGRPLLRSSSTESPSPLLPPPARDEEEEGERKGDVASSSSSPFKVRRVYSLPISFPSSSTPTTSSQIITSLLNSKVPRDPLRLSPRPSVIKSFSSKLSLLTENEDNYSMYYNGLREEKKKNNNNNNKMSCSVDDQPPSIKSSDDLSPRSMTFRGGGGGGTTPEMINHSAAAAAAAAGDNKDVTATSVLSGRTIKDCMDLTQHLNQQKLLPNGPLRAAFVMVALNPQHDLHQDLAKVARYFCRISSNKSNSSAFHGGGADDQGDNNSNNNALLRLKLAAVRKDSKRILKHISKGL